jgi:N-acetylmuramoyl-L-alanine amidase
MAAPHTESTWQRWSVENRPPDPPPTLARLSSVTADIEALARSALNIAAMTSVAAENNSAPQNAPVLLTMLSWDSQGKESVEITLTLSGPASCTSRILKSRDGSRLRLTLDRVTAVEELGDGVSVRDSLLRNIHAIRQENATVLDLDFGQKTDIVTSQAPGLIVVRARAAKTTMLRRAEDAGAGLAGTARPVVADAEDSRFVSIADQLSLTVNRIYIDAGHGGRDPGACSHNVQESDVSLDVAYTLGRLLQACGLDVVYSRTRDETLSLTERTRRANETRADIFVSVHVNANADTSVHGFETYYLDFAANAEAARVAALENAVGDQRLGDMQRLMAEVMVNARVEESVRLARALQQLTVSRLASYDFTVKNNGVKAAPFHVLIGAHMPAVLVELGYCTNSAEAARLASPAYRLALAEGLAVGILNYKNSLSKGSAMQAELTR